jgi:hypothetical protein
MVVDKHGGQGAVKTLLISRGSHENLRRFVLEDGRVVLGTHENVENLKAHVVEDVVFLDWARKVGGFFFCPCRVVLNSNSSGPSCGAVVLVVGTETGAGTQFAKGELLSNAEC